MEHRVGWHGISWNLKRCSITRAKSAGQEKSERKPVQEELIKYCERCGLLLGEVDAKRKYCSECLRISSKTSKCARKKEREVATCAYCGKPMVKNVGNQKYHKECAYAAQKKRIAELRDRYKEIGYKNLQEQKKSQKSQKDDSGDRKVLSIAEVQRLAEKHHMTYAMASWKIATGELTYER